MSVNAFYDAFGATQNALGDPRGDAERRRQQEMQNAMQQRQMQMREFQFGQEQQEAQRAEQERQRVARTNQWLFEQRTKGAKPRPAMGAPSMPMVNPQMAAQGQAAPMAIGGAPIAPQAQAVDPASGRQVEQVTVTGTQRMPVPPQEDVNMAIMRRAYDANDVTTFNEYFDIVRANMSEQEKAARQQIAVIAGELENEPDENLANAVIQAMQQFNIDPDTTNIDEYLDDPPRLRRAIALERALGAPQKSAEANVDVMAYGRKQQLEKQYGPLIEVDGGDKIYLVDGNNRVVDTIVKGISAETRFKEGAATGRNNNDNATSAANSKRAAAAKDKDDGTVPTVVSIREVK